MIKIKREEVKKKKYKSGWKRVFINRRGSSDIATNHGKEESGPFELGAPERRGG